MFKVFNLILIVLFTLTSFSAFCDGHVNENTIFRGEIWVRDVLVGEERVIEYDVYPDDAVVTSLQLIGSSSFKNVQRICTSASDCKLRWTIFSEVPGEFDGYIEERRTFTDEEGNVFPFRVVMDIAVDVGLLDEDPLCSEDFPGSIISADGRNLREMIDIVGTQMSLVYASSRSALYPTPYTNATRENSYNPEDWSVSSLHFYNKEENGLFLGDGRFLRRAHSIDENGNSVVVSRAEVFVFAPDGRHLQTKSSLLGFVKHTMSYDTDLKISKITDAYGLETLFTRDIDGNLQSIISPYGQVTQIGVDANGRLISVANPNQETHQITYYENGLISSFTTPRGLTSTFKFSGAAQLLEARGAGGNLWQLDFVIEEGGAKETTVRSKLERETRLLTNRDANGRFSRQKVSPSGFVENYSETFRGDQVYSNVFESLQVQTVPDERFLGIDDRVQRRVETVDDLTRVVEMSQSVDLSDLSDPFSYQQLTRTMTENGITSTLNFDKNSRVLTFNGALGSQSKITLDQFERAISSQVATDNPVEMSYNAIGKIAQISQNNVALQSFAYNDKGELSSVTNVLNQTTSYRRDAAGRVVEIISPNQQSILIQYDADGNMTGLAPAQRMTHFLEYNLFDLLGGYNPPEIENFVEVRTSFAYNQDKQLIAIYRPDEDVVNLTYDEITGQILSKGGQVYEHYPNTDLIQSIVSNDLVESEFTYKGTKLLASETQRIGQDELSLSFEYDNFMRPITRSIAVDGVVQSTTQTSYDDEGRISNIAGMQVNYELLSGRVSSTQAGVVTDQRFYDTNGNLSRYEARISNELVYSYQFERDELQRIIKKTEVMQGQTNTFEYTYDEMGQLITVIKNGASESSYVYDSNGNMIEGVMNGSPFSATYNEQDRLLSFNAEQVVEQVAQISMVMLSESTVSESKVHENKKSKKLKKEKAKKSFMEKLKSFFKKPKNTVRYVACKVLNRKGKGPKFCQDIEDPTDPEDPVDPEDPEDPVDPVNPVIPLSGVGAYFYNASGELIRLEAIEGNTVFSRGELGVINSVTLPSSQSINYKTDYNARRVEKLNSLSQNYRRIYQNQLQVAAEMKGTELSEYIYATRVNIPELVKKSGQTYRVITDHLGSPVLVINTADGTIEAQAQYNEWGRVIEETNAGFMPFGFAGGLRDLDTGLVRFGVRDYSPNTARWISKDPIGFNGGDANLYRYCLNDPANCKDFKGESPAGVLGKIINGVMSTTAGSFVTGNLGGKDLNEGEEEELQKYKSQQAREDLLKNNGVDDMNDQPMSKPEDSIDVDALKFDPSLPMLKPHPDCL